jgi:membrane protein DedA with SNARE-associated domain
VEGTVKMLLEDVVSTYGYAGVVIGTFLEGETILILGAFAANLGYLSLEWVMVSGFLGGIFGDQLYFYLGHFQGRRLLERRPRWKLKTDRVLDLMARHQTMLILGFRFVYGIRIITPLLIGASRIKPLYYLLLDGIGVAVWATLITYLGYLFGSTLEIIIGDIKQYEFIVIGIIAAVGALVWAIRFIKR